MNLFDNTLRDGGNVVGHGFSVELTKSIISGLLNAGIKDIEMGNCKGLGAYDLLNAANCPSDEAYLEAVQPYLWMDALGCLCLQNVQIRIRFVQQRRQGSRFFV